MARNVLQYTVTDPGRDNGKLFILTEMPATQGEAWAARAILALMKNGVDMPDGFDRLGMAGIAEIGFKMLSKCAWEDLNPLMAELMGCVTIQVTPGKAHTIRPLIEEDIEEILTRMKLKAEVFKLHVDFLKAVAPSILAAVQPGDGKPA